MRQRKLIYWIAFGITLSVVVPVLGTVISQVWFAPDDAIEHLPVHSLIEAMGGFMAITIAGILLAERSRYPDCTYYTWMACGLIGMGVLDLFHAGVQPGKTFVWLHSTATFVGGAAFALVWWRPGRWLQPRLHWFPAMTFAATVALGAASCTADWLPAMIERQEDAAPALAVQFTPLAHALNVGGGIGFLLAAVFFIRRFHRTGGMEDWLFAVHTSLFGAAGILFELSRLWDPAWWWWHILRFGAYLAALAFATRAYLNAEREILQLNRDLTRVNEGLDRTIAERTAKLRESEERYALSVRGSSDGLWDWNVLTDEVYYAPRFKELLGYDDAEFPNRFATFESRLHAEDLESTLTALRQHLNRVSPYDVEYRLRTKSGNYRWFRARGQAIWNAEGQATRMAGSITDIHDRKEAEAALKYERFLLKTLLTHLPDAIYFKDLQGRFTRVSHALAEQLGAQSTDDVIGKSDSDFFHAEFAEATWADEQAVMRTGVPIVGKEEQPQRDGQSRWVSTTKVPLYDRQGKIAGIVGISHDITAVKEAEARFRHVVEAAPNPMVVVASDGSMRLVNPATERLFGYSREELIGEPIEMLLPERMREQHVQFRREYFQNPSARAMGPQRELHARRRDGTEFSVEIGLSPIELDQQTMVLSSVYDVTLRKRAEEALVQAKEAAEQANQAKSDFLANMSHEIRTPMNAIIGMSELLLDDNLSSVQYNYSRTILEAAESLLTIINEILDFSKIEAGHLELQFVDFDLREQIVDMLRALGTRAHLKNVELIWQVESDVPKYVRGDPLRIRQVLLNLVGNAIKFTEDGEVTVSVRCQSETPDNVRLRFSVRDTGIGIPADKLECIFAAFTQADGSTTRQFGGTGLGLTISTRLVQAMGGRIEVESDVGVGSTFHFTVEMEQSQRTSDVAHGEMEWADLRGLPALVVDDNATNREVLQQILHSWGFSVATVAGAPEALDYLTLWSQSGAKLPLVLSDVNMPEMDGYMLVERIRSSALLRDAVVLLLTSGGRPGDIARGRELGVAGQLIKPVKSSELLEAVMVALGCPTPIDEPTSETIEETTTSQNRLKILLAEDGKANQYLARALLEKWGHTVEIAENGIEAVALWQRGDFDLILMDVQMPKLDGLEATQWIRNREATDGGHIPIVAMTARAMKGDRERCLAAGMDGYVAKPVRQQELRAALAPFFGLAVETPGKETPVAKVATTGIDWATALRNTNGSQELLKEMIDVTLDETRSLLPQLEQALRDGNGQTAKRLAHTIKAAGRTFGAQPLWDQAERIEEFAPNGRLDAAGDLMVEFRKTVEGFIHELEHRAEQVS